MEAVGAYEDRLVAFLDILNFSGMVNETIDSQGNDVAEKISAIDSAFGAIHRNWDADEPNTSKKITIFSDCIVVSVKTDEPSSLFWTILEIKHLIMSLVWHGILVRGAMVRGKLLHDDKRIFGPGLIEAHILESKAALYPRVILDRELINLAKEARSSIHTPDDEKGYVRGLLEADSDGMFYIDYFFKAFGELDNPDYDFPSYVNRLGEIIRKGRQGSTHPSRADVRVKYSWMRERYNRMIDNVQMGLAKGQGSGEFPDDVAAVYSGLRKIGRA